MKTLWLVLLHKIVVAGMLRLLCAYRIWNRQVFQNQDQFILVSNHNSHLDTLALVSSLPIHLIGKVYIVAAGDYFGRTKIQAWCMRICFNVLLINRQHCGNPQGVHPVASMEALLGQGYSLLIYPEGTRGTSGVLGPFRSGIGRLLKAFPEIPYLPAYLTGAERCLPKGTLFPLPCRITLYLGKPKQPYSRDVAGIVKEVESRVKALGAKSYGIYRCEPGKLGSKPFNSPYTPA